MSGVPSLYQFILGTGLPLIWQVNLNCCVTFRFKSCSPITRGGFSETKKDN